MESLSNYLKCSMFLKIKYNDHLYIMFNGIQNKLLFDYQNKERFQFKTSSFLSFE